MAVRWTPPCKERATALASGSSTPARSIARAIVLIALAIPLIAISEASPASASDVMIVRTAPRHLAQESTTTTQGDGDESTTTTTEPEQEDAPDGGEASGGRSDPTVWQWLLLIGLAAGAAVVITRSRPAAEPPRSQGVDARALLQRYQEAAAAIASAPDSSDEITYQVGVLGGLSSLFEAIILQTSGREEKAALLSVNEAVIELENGLRAASADLRVESAGALGASAAVVSKQVDRAMDIL
jgi:hypothetical protein